MLMQYHTEHFGESGAHLRMHLCFQQCLDTQSLDVSSKLNDSVTGMKPNIRNRC